jgi:hypothetical protein
MAAEPRSEPVIPDAIALTEGLRGAFGIFLAEADISHAVGETGVLRGTVEIFIERGRARHSKGSVSFEHRMELRGRG